MTVTVGPRGEVTFAEDFLRHLGIKPGEKVVLSLLPHNCVEVRAARQSEDSPSLYALLKNKTDGSVLTIDEINQSTSGD